MTDELAEADDSWGPLDGLPGNPMMWILILGEMVVFAVLLVGFAVARLIDPATFADGQSHLDRTVAGLDTIVLIASGWLAAVALERVRQGASGRPQLAGAMALGASFLVLKAHEYGTVIAGGHGIESDAFHTLYFLITGFHALHVVLGIGILGVVARWNSPDAVETGTAFWHMVDLIWLLVFPMLYLVR